MNVRGVLKFCLLFVVCKHNHKRKRSCAYFSELLVALRTAKYAARNLMAFLLQMSGGKIVYHQNCNQIYCRKLLECG